MHNLKGEVNQSHCNGSSLSCHGSCLSMPCSALSYFLLSKSCSAFIYSSTTSCCAVYGQSLPCLPLPCPGSVIIMSTYAHSHIIPVPIVENHVAQKFVNKKINFPRLRIIQLYSNPSLMWYRFPLSLSLVATLPLLCTPPHTVTMYSATPSLQDLTRGTLQRQVPEPHQTMHYSRLIHSSMYINKKRLNCMYCTYAVHGDCKRTCIKIILKQTCLFL